MHGVIEEQVIQSATTPPKTWKHFVDDSFAIINKNAITSFHDTLNSIDPHIKFTIEYEKDEQIAFLDMLISRQNNSNYPRHTISQSIQTTTWTMLHTTT